MPDLDGFQGCNSRADKLAATGKPCHQVRLNQASCDFQVCFDVVSVDPDGDAPGTGSQEGVFVQ
jgi:hypothetical protein